MLSEKTERSRDESSFMSSISGQVSYSRRVAPYNNDSLNHVVYVEIASLNISRRGAGKAKPLTPKFAKSIREDREEGPATRTINVKSA